MRSPLCDAVHNNDDRLLNFLVRRCKANVDAQFPDASGTSASLLHVAADRGHKSIIQTLQTDYKLDINQLDSLYRHSHFVHNLILRGRTPLFYCSRMELYEFMQANGALENVTNQTEDSFPIFKLL